MCGFLSYKEKGDNSKIRFRGQDFTNVHVQNGFTFIHNLLSVTGDFTVQPFIDGDIVCLFNGEIYGRSFKKSDGENIIPLYRQYGESFFRLLDGEFAIAIYDFEKGKALFATDPFGSKPLWVNGSECGSYRSGVGGEKIRPNSARIVSLNDDTFHEIEGIVWDFDHQTKDTYEDWISAFEESIRKRAKNDCFLGLSSGYDSGAITCELLKQNIDFKAYSYLGHENKDVLEKRLLLVPNYELFEPKRYDLPIDNERYTIYYKGEQTEMRALDDGGIFGVASICDLAQKEGRKVMISGQGADEIMSDYALFPDQSELKGVFPEKLSKWRNFDRGCQESYLMKEEFAAGSFNIETRYPFLDKKLVQEFLWLSPGLKNRNYKAPLYEYLTRNGFPFQEGKKTGFSVYV